jgi:hypothetical protein
MSNVIPFPIRPKPTPTLINQKHAFVCLQLALFRKTDDRKRYMMALDGLERLHKVGVKAWPFEVA